MKLGEICWLLRQFNLSRYADFWRSILSIPWELPANLPCQGDF